MANWQRRMWEELIERQPILPRRGGALLVIGDEMPAKILSMGDLIVAHCAWNEVPVKGLAYDRVLLVANKDMPDAELALARAAEVLKQDGSVVIVAAREWPWAMEGSLWCDGMSRGRWKKWLKRGGWRLVYTSTAGGISGLWRWVPGSGVVRVMIAKRSGKGGGLRVVEPKLMPKGKMATVAG